MECLLLISGTALDTAVWRRCFFSAYILLGLSGQLRKRSIWRRRGADQTIPIERDDPPQRGRYHNKTVYHMLTFRWFTALFTPNGI